MAELLTLSRLGTKPVFNWSVFRMAHLRFWRMKECKAADAFPSKYKTCFRLFRFPNDTHLAICDFAQRVRDDLQELHDVVVL